MQSALNYFGFEVGAPDGRFGPKTRSGMANYQAYMGYPVDGTINEFEKQTLLTSYDRAIAGGALTVQQVASLPEGPRGLLKVYQQPAALAPAPVAPSVVPPAPAPVEVVADNSGTISVEKKESGLLPSFGGALAVGSMRSHCDKVTLRVSEAGGYTTLSTMTDPAVALDEQFCIARLHAITVAEALVEDIDGMSEDQMLAECQGLVPAFQKQVASLSFSDVEVVMSDTKAVVVSSGQSPAQLRGIGQVCMGLGYKTDNADLVVSSALMLTGSGNTPYAEVLGHHLNSGFGASERSDLAAQWYVTAVDALNSGQNAVFSANDPERTALLSDAANRLVAGNSESASSGVFQVPSFNTD